MFMTSCRCPKEGRGPAVCAIILYYPGTDIYVSLLYELENTVNSKKWYRYFQLYKLYFLNYTVQYNSGRD